MSVADLDDASAGAAVAVRHGVDERADEAARHVHEAGVPTAVRPAVAGREPDATQLRRGAVGRAGDAAHLRGDSLVEAHVHRRRAAELRAALERTAHVHDADPGDDHRCVGHGVARRDGRVARRHAGVEGCVHVRRRGAGVDGRVLGDGGVGGRRGVDRGEGGVVAHRGVGRVADVLRGVGVGAIDDALGAVAAGDREGRREDDEPSRELHHGSTSMWAPCGPVP